ncbi:hypothetical protein MesoLjLc_77070 [Mesorhizobium sp. L-8-10]|nr:hypothetical protein MesoLjLc_77070 [Mesorhizobium sp. L-8-10]
MRQNPQPGLPMKKGRAGTMTHDYKRHGTTTLFAALDVKTGAVIGECQPKHRAKEFIRFLRTIDRNTPKSLDVHLIVDNYSTHKTQAVKDWLAKHPRFKLHFIPTSSSWLNQVERFFAEITRKRIRRGVFTSVAQLETAICDYLDAHNADSKPFVWTKSADVILAKVHRARAALDAAKTRNQALESEHYPPPSFVTAFRNSTFMHLPLITSRTSAARSGVKTPEARRSKIDRSGEDLYMIQILYIVQDWEDFDDMHLHRAPRAR